MSIVKKRSYYDIIAGLSAFECSQDVSLNPHDLQELVTEGDESDEQPEKVEEDVKRKRNTVHGYLGGKVDLNEATNASYDLSHTLLGGYVPKRQLESLSSIDFAHYFHKSLECENALQVYDLLVGSGYGRIPVHINGKSGDSRESTTASTSNNPVDSNGSEARTESRDNKAVRKVVVCKKCKSRFSGPRRMQMFKNHVCNIS